MYNFSNKCFNYFIGPRYARILILRRKYQGKTSERAVNFTKNSYQLIFFFLNTDFWFLKDGGSWMWRVIVSFHTLLFIYLLHSTIASLKWKYRKLPRDIKAFTTKDIQILEKVVTLKRLEMMDSGKRYFYNLVQSLHKQSVPGGRDSLLGAVVQFERHLKAKGIFLTGLTVILIPSKKMLSYINNSRESW